ncbi:MAG: hypothetical protein M3Q50_02860 [Chloroflexota bacterium]|nr:hypothetical protein [Chloroflexota bacterium]
MTRKLTQQIVLAAFAAVLVFAPVTSLAPSATLALQGSGGFHWARQQTPFTLQVGDNVDGGWNSMLSAVVADWNRGDTVSFQIVGGATTPQECRSKPGTVQMCNGQYGQPVGWLGLTRLYFDRSGHIDAATVQMNDSFFNANNGQYNSDAARRHTMCHELGHTPGLDHVNTDSCMNDSTAAIFNNLEPINKDFQQLARIYQHSDSTNTIAGSPKKKKKKKKGKGKGRKNTKKTTRGASTPTRTQNGAASTENFFDPAVMPGALSALDGSETVSVERLDDGTQIVTFITWAEK